MMLDICLWILALVTLAFSLDDLFIDVIAYRRGLRPRIIKENELAEIQSRHQRRIGIIVANWKESDVIEWMVRGNIRRLKYDNYHFFLGVYPNDIETLQAAQRASVLFPQHVTVIVNTLPGPTSKGQMLNQIVQQVLESEEVLGVRWDAFLMQDSEDVLHPYSLSVLNDACDVADFIQLPVYSFVVPLSKWIGSLYVDEFSEVHTKDLLVRCSLGAAVPSAGVGTLIQRDLVLKLIEKQDGCFLNEDTLTEDYQLGMLSKELGFKTHFHCVALEESEGKHQVIATREFFPDKLRASVRQKARWSLGIVYQGMDCLKWRGEWIDKYFLWRDRRGPLNAITILFSAILFVLVAGTYLVNLPGPKETGGLPLDVVLGVNVLFMFWRVGQRIRFVTYINGWRSAIGVLPRWFIGNFVNTLASVKAYNDYKTSKINGVRPAWQKTAHVLPAEFGQEKEVRL